MKNGPRYEFMSCLSPFFNRYDKLVELVEFIEMSKILGVGFIAMFNHSASPQINRLLNVYQNEGSVSIRQHILPDVRVEDVAKGVSYWDCLFRYRYRAKYIVFIDADEIVFPIKQDNLSALFKSFSNSERCAEFSFHRKEFWELNPELNVTFPIFEQARKANSTILVSVQDMGMRLKKAIVDPRKIDAPGTHHAVAMRNGFKRCDISKKDSLVFHYRVKPNHGQVFTGIDSSIHKYSYKLIPALKHRWDILRIFNVT